MKAILERDLLIGSCPVVKRNRRIERLEVEMVERILERADELIDPGSIYDRPAPLPAVHLSSLGSAELLRLGYVFKPENASPV